VTSKSHLKISAIFLTASLNSSTVSNKRNQIPGGSLRIAPRMAPGCWPFPTGCTAHRCGRSAECPWSCASQQPGRLGFRRKILGQSRGNQWKSVDLPMELGKSWEIMDLISWYQLVSLFPADVPAKTQFWDLVGMASHEENTFFPLVGRGQKSVET